MHRFLEILGVCALLAVFSPLLAGCLNLGKGTLEPPRFFLLSELPTLDAPRGSTTATPNLAIGVGPVILPDHLDRPQIVIRTSRNEIQISEFAQWAEPLANSVPLVLIENLSTLLGSNHVVAYPRRVSIPIEVQVVVRIVQFDAEIGGNASLVARWALLDREQKTLRAATKSVFEEPLGDGGYEVVAATESRLLGALSREIAEAIVELANQESR